MPTHCREVEGITGSSPFICRMHEHLSGCITLSGASSTGSGVAWFVVPRLGWCQQWSQQQPTCCALDYVACGVGWPLFSCRVCRRPPQAGRSCLGDQRSGSVWIATWFASCSELIYVFRAVILDQHLSNHCSTGSWLIWSVGVPSPRS